jgi:protein tyrosine phosphatase (PTP) superfamily phosphohydrolase (DUF442 family)
MDLNRIDAQQEELPPVRLSPDEKADLARQREAMENEGGGVNVEPGRDRAAPVVPANSEPAHTELARRPGPPADAKDQSAERRPGLMTRLSDLFHRHPKEASHLDLRRVDASVAFGTSPNVEEVERLAQRLRVRSILNLNTEGEEGQVLSPNVEASWAETFALQHKRVSIDPALVSSEEADRFLEELRTIEKPVYVHSLHGRRAAAFVILWLAVERRRTGNEALAEARELGIECDSEPLRNFAASEANRRFVSSSSARR